MNQKKFTDLLYFFAVFFILFVVGVVLYRIEHPRESGYLWNTSSASITPVASSSATASGTSNAMSNAVASSASSTVSVSSAPVAAGTQFPYELILGGTTINLEAATTPAAQEKGLSDRPSLPQNQGMLFIFPTAGYYQFWMINMSFSLDMIWLDQNFKVVGIKQDATPASYPATFMSDAPAEYVIEVNNGFVDQYGIKEGDTLDVQGVQ